LYRFKNYMKLCGDIASEGIDLHPRGSRDRREDAAGHPSVHLEAFTDDQAFQDPIETGALDPSEDEDD
jgi:hypothetical protein